MAVPTLNKLKPYPEFQDLANHINRLVGELNDLLVNLDTLNITKLNAKVIEAGTITAEKMNVTELSAITANLGHITAGLIEAVTIIGSLIQTRPAGVYPRIELSSSSNLLRAAHSASNYAEIIPVAGTDTSFNFWSGGYGTFINQSSNLFNIISPYNININGSNVFIDDLVIDNGVKVGTISVPYSGGATATDFVLNELITALRNMNIVA